MDTDGIVLDGPMGTQLGERGVPIPAPGWSAYALETHPDVIAAIHFDYVRAGADVHRTNTFRTQPHVFPDRWRKLITTAVQIARKSVPADVAGSIAPYADCYRPDLFPGEGEARLCHRAVARALAEEGVDLLVCETFPHALEARIAVEEASSTGIPTWAALTAGPDGSLMTPEAMEKAARDCVSAGAAAVLVCCTAATKTLAYVERLAKIGVPFGAYANAGEPSDGLGFGVDGAAEKYAAIAKTWIDAGAMIVGACCGTGPDHIAKIRLRGSSVAPR